MKWNSRWVTTLLTLVCIAGLVQTVQAAETLSISFSTSAAGSEYEPKNVVAVWIEDSDGNFRKTILRWAGERRSELIDWWTACGRSNSDVDGLSGATRLSHFSPPTLQATWDMTDRAGGMVPDGLYSSA